MENKKSQKNNTNNKKPKEKSSTREQKNKYLYDQKLERDKEIEKTRQQKFNFENNDLEDELDTSFVEKKKPRKKILEQLEKQERIEEKKVYPIKTIVTLIFLILILIGFISYHFLSFNHHKVKIVTKVKVEEKEVVPENILFLGDSITDFYDLEKYYEGINVVNSGISGNTTEDILKNMKKRVYQYNPSKIFLLIGTNDLIKDKENEEIIKDIEEIAQEINQNRPKAQLYIESIYPVNQNISPVDHRENSDIKEINEKVKEYCEENKITYIDLYKELQDEDENLNKEYTKDGLHLNDKGYEVVTKKIKPMLQEKTKTESKK